MAAWSLLFQTLTKPVYFSVERMADPGWPARFGQNRAIMKPANAKMTMAVLSVVLVVAVGLCGYERWQIHQWKALVSGLARVQGVFRANQEYKQGKLQLFAVHDFLDIRTSVTNEGPFKVLPFGYHPKEFQGRYVAEAFVEGYNERMRTFHEHPERWVTTTNAPDRTVWWSY